MTTLPYRVFTGVALTGEVGSASAMDSGGSFDNDTSPATTLFAVGSAGVALFAVGVAFFAVGVASFLR